MDRLVHQLIWRGDGGKEFVNPVLSDKLLPVVSYGKREVNACIKITEPP